MQAACIFDIHMQTAAQTILQAVRPGAMPSPTCNCAKSIRVGFEASVALQITLKRVDSYGHTGD